MPVYQKQQMYPNSKFPFISKEYPHKISYKKGICPVAEKMSEKELLIATLCHPPHIKKDIDLFVKSIKKIEQNITGLKRYEKKA